MGGIRAVVGVVALSSISFAGAAMAATGDEGCVDAAPAALEGLSALAVPVHPSCRADMVSKTYPNGVEGSRSWYGVRRVEVECSYTCRADNLPTRTIKGTRTVRIWGSEAGWELACYAVPYVQRYNNYRGWFVYVPDEPKSFSPAKSDVRELKEWAATGKLPR